MLDKIWRKFFSKEFAKMHEAEVAEKIPTEEQEFTEEDLNSDLPEGNANLYWSAPLFIPEDDDLPF